MGDVVRLDDYRPQPANEPEPEYAVQLVPCISWLGTLIFMPPSWWHLTPPTDDNPAA